MVVGGNLSMVAKTSNASETMQIYPNQVLSSINKEYHTRKKMAYIAEDKHHTVVILSQRISDIVKHINNFVTDEPDPVSIAGIYQALGKTWNRNAGYAKHRWRVQPVDLELAAEAFDCIRQRGFEQAFIVGDRQSYRIGV